MERGGPDQEKSNLIATDFEVTLLEAIKGWSSNRKLVVALVSVVIVTEILEGIVYLVMRQKISGCSEKFRSNFSKIHGDIRKHFDNFDDVKTRSEFDEFKTRSQAGSLNEDLIRKHFSNSDDSKTRSEVDALPMHLLLQ